MFKGIDIYSFLTVKEVQSLGIVIVVLVSLNIILYAMFILFARLEESKLKSKLHEIIYSVDEFADTMKNTEKRLIAINRVKDLFGWLRFGIPSFLIGLIIDAEVAAIRKMQESTNTPDMHKGE